MLLRGLGLKRAYEIPQVSSSAAAFAGSSLIL